MTNQQQAEVTCHDLASYLVNFAHLYPNIARWAGKVYRDALLGRREVFLATDGSQILGTAVTKRGLVGKLCHLSVHPNLRGMGVASRLAGLAVRDLHNHQSKEIVVTTSESTFNKFSGFFRWLGFSALDWQYERYICGTSEVIWSGATDDLVDRVYQRQLLEAWKASYGTRWLAEPFVGAARFGVASDGDAARPFRAPFRLRS